jgi:hypothetical protein
MNKNGRAPCIVAGDGGERSGGECSPELCCIGGYLAQKKLSGMLLSIYTSISIAKILSCRFVYTDSIDMVLCVASDSMG